MAIYEELPENMAHGWFDPDGDGVYEELPSSDSFNSSNAGAVYSTPEDLAKWVQALFHDGRFLYEDTLDQMLTFHSPTPGESLLAGYGLGAASYSPELFNGLEIWGHSGNAAGYASGCLYIPDYGVSIGIMVNTDSGEAMFTINDILTIITNQINNNQ